jgi:hypothetical protein
VDPVPDTLLLRKSGSTGNRTRDVWVSSQELWPLDHKGGLKCVLLIWTANIQACTESRCWSDHIFSSLETFLLLQRLLYFRPYFSVSSYMVLVAPMNCSQFASVRICSLWPTPLSDAMFRMILVLCFCSAEAEVLQKSEIVQNESIEAHRVSSSAIQLAYAKCRYNLIWSWAFTDIHMYILFLFAVFRGLHANQKRCGKLKYKTGNNSIQLFLIYVPNLQLQSHLQTQHRADMGNYTDIGNLSKYRCYRYFQSTHFPSKYRPQSPMFRRFLSLPREKGETNRIVRGSGHIYDHNTVFAISCR